MKCPKRLPQFVSILAMVLSLSFFLTVYGVEFVDRAAKSDSIVDHGGETQFTLRPGDAPSDASARAQRAEKMPSRARAERWYRYRWETWLPATTPRDIAQDVLIMQWRNRVGGPRTSIHLDRGKWLLRINRLDGKPQQYLLDAALESWTKWEMFVYWSEKDDGYIRLICGGVVVEHEGPNIWPADTGGNQAPQWSFGLYRPQWKHGKLRHERELELRRIKFRNYDYNPLSDAQRSTLGLPTGDVDVTEPRSDPGS